MPRPLILASSSPYRRAQMQQLRLRFQAASPHIDEGALPNESPRSLARRLAGEKAQALRQSYPDALIIGSDQVAECEGHRLGKPGSPDKAVSQLSFCSGRTVFFHTGISVLDAASGEQRTEVDIFSVKFRRLSEAQILRYVELEKPFDCAGSFKVEGLGIALFEKMEGSDYNSLVGLPLIRLIDLLAEFDVDVLAQAVQGTSGGHCSSSEK